MKNFTDEQVEAVARDYHAEKMSPMTWEQIPEHWREEDRIVVRIFLSLPSVQALMAQAWSEGAGALSDWHESPKGHWSEYHPKTGVRRFIEEPAPTNPYEEQA